MSRLLILYSTTDGHTVRICERLRAVVEALGPQRHGQARGRRHGRRPGALRRRGHRRQHPLRQAQARGRCFIARHQAALEAKPNAFFSVNVVARKPGKDRPEANPYLLKFLRGIAWKPQRLAVFAGKIDYPSYGALDRTMIRFIMWMTKGPTDPTAVIEFTNWGQVETFGAEIARMAP